MLFELPIDSKITEELASEIIKESAFISPRIKNFELDLSNKIVQIELDSEKNAEVVLEQTKRFLVAMTHGFRESESRVIFEHQRTKQQYENDIYNKLLLNDWLHEVGPGHVSLAGPVLRLFHLIDAKILELYRGQFSLLERSFPAFIPSETVAECGYFDSHPNNVTLATHLINDFDVIENFRINEGKTGDFSTVEKSHIATPCLCLNPAACLPAYPMYKDKSISNPIILSWLGRIFRFESTNIKGLERLWEFNVRELVFLGPTNFVNENKLEAIGLVKELIKYLGLDAKIQTATDPFFATVSNAKKLWQKSLEAKFEIKLPISCTEGSEQSIAAGSINSHSTFFSDKFNISMKSECVETACVGLGIERILFACFAQHGLNKATWPTKVAEQIF